VLGSVLQRFEAAEIDGCFDLGGVPVDPVGVEVDRKGGAGKRVAERCWQSFVLEHRGVEAMGQIA
jgi:hypothetical protein